MNHRDLEATRPVSGYDCHLRDRRLWQQAGTAMAQRRVVTAAVKPVRRSGTAAGWLLALAVGIAIVGVVEMWPMLAAGWRR